jgi:hypothetical protein
MGKLRRRQRTNKNRSRSAKHHKKIINMKGCSNGSCGQTGGCCGLMTGGGSKTQGQTGGAWSMWNPTSGGEFYKLNTYGVQADRMMEATQTTLGSAKFGGGGRSRRKGRKNRMIRRSKGRTIRNKKRQQNGGSIIQELLNAKGDFMDMAGSAYASYKGITPMPSSAVYRDQFSKVV